MANGRKKKPTIKARNLEMHKGLRLDRRSAGPMKNDQTKRNNRSNEKRRAIDEHC